MIKIEQIIIKYKWDDTKQEKPTMLEILKQAVVFNTLNTKSIENITCKSVTK